MLISMGDIINVIYVMYYVQYDMYVHNNVIVCVCMNYIRVYPLPNLTISFMSFTRDLLCSQSIPSSYLSSLFPLSLSIVYNSKFLFFFFWLNILIGVPFPYPAALILPSGMAQVLT